jgi:MraZ protein
MAQAIPPNQFIPHSFWGQYRCTIDTDGYLLLPDDFPEADPFILTKGLDGCLLLAPQGYFSSLREKVQALPFTDKLSRSFRRHLFASAMNASPDQQRRIYLPDGLRRYANLADAAVVVGNDAYLEIWDASDWERTQLQVTEQIVQEDGWRLEGI